MRPDETLVSQPVRSLQTMLRHLSEADDRYSPVVPDGIYGTQTQKAVSNFQRLNGIPVTGVANQETWEKVASSYEDALVILSPAEPLQLILNPGMTYRRGDTSYNIFIIQAVLLALAAVYSSMSAPDMTGILDEQTAQSIMSFQYLNGLPETGEVDKITWKNMALHYPMAVNHLESENKTRR